MRSKARKKDGKVRSIYIIAGKDSYIRASCLSELLNRIKDVFGSVDVVKLSGTNTKPVDLLGDLHTASFWGRKVVILEDADKFIAANRDILEEYFKSPSSDSTLIIIADTWSSNTRLAKMLPAVGEVILADNLSRERFICWVAEYVERAGKKIGLAAIERLIQMVGQEMVAVANELDKLISFVGERGEITEEDIEVLCGDIAEQSIFELNNAILRKDARSAFRLLDKILENDPSAEYTLCGVIAFGLRRLLQVRSLIEQGSSEEEISRELRLYPRYVRQLIDQAKRFRVDELTRLIDALTEADFSTKSGLGRMRINIEKFIICATGS